MAEDEKDVLDSGLRQQSYIYVCENACYTVLIKKSWTTQIVWWCNKKCRSAEDYDGKRLHA
jgi:hypothetical protein